MQRWPALKQARLPLRSAPWRLGGTLLALCAAVLLSGCDTLSFAVANLPPRLSQVTRLADIRYADGPRGLLDIYLPPGGSAAVAGRPVLVFFYGGGWTSGSRQQYRFAATALAQLGYVTVVPDYRLYPAVRFPAFVEDGARAVAWVQQHIAGYGGDAQRLVLMGHSAGAYAADMLTVEPGYLRQAGGDPSRIAGLVSLSGPHNLTPNTAVLHSIFSAPHVPAEWRATERVQGRGPPTLLLHGGEDTLVGSADSALFADLLRARGTEVTLRIYPRCNHSCPVAALSLPARRLAPTLADVAAFLARLGTPPGEVRP